MVIEKTISSEDTFTDWKLFTGGKQIDVSVSDLSDSTVTLQRKFTKYGDILDADTWESDEETYFVASATAYYRIGIKGGDYGSDTVKVKLAV